MLMSIFRLFFEKNPEVYLLGLKMEEFIKEDRVIICYAVAADRNSFAQKWRLAECPSAENWMVKLSNFMDMDKLTRHI